MIFINMKLLALLMMATKLIYAAGTDGEVDYKSLACTTDNKKYSIKLYAHLEMLVIEAIRSASATAVEAGTITNEKDAVASYLGTIVDNFNEYLKPYKVEFDLDLNSYNVDEFLVTSGFDKSCEVDEPVITRTTIGYNHFLKAYKGRTGIHLFIWGCPYFAEKGLDKLVIKHENCGNGLGMLWRGASLSREYIYSLLMEAISGQKGLFLDGIVPLRQGSGICSFADKCISSESSVNGQIIYDTTDYYNTGAGTEQDGISEDSA